jgi:hypothetical protein
MRISLNPGLLLNDNGTFGLPAPIRRSASDDASGPDAADEQRVRPTQTLESTGLGSQ